MTYLFPRPTLPVHLSPESHERTPPRPLATPSAHEGRGVGSPEGEGGRGYTGPAAILRPKPSMAQTHTSGEAAQLKYIHGPGAIWLRTVPASAGLTGAPLRVTVTHERAP